MPNPAGWKKGDMVVVRDVVWRDGDWELTHIGHPHCWVPGIYVRQTRGHKNVHDVLVPSVGAIVPFGPGYIKSPAKE